MAKIYVEVKMFKKKKNKYFPYGHQFDSIGAWHARTKKDPIKWTNRTKKENSNIVIYIIVIFIACFVGLFLFGCSYTPVVDSRGKSSANIDGDMDRFHDDLYTCKDIVKDNTNSVLNASKKVYNAFRWRLLWMSPKLETNKDMVDKCLVGRGYSVLK